MTSGTGHAVFPGHQGRYRLPRRDSSELLLRGLELPLAAQLREAAGDLSCSHGVLLVSLAVSRNEDLAFSGWRQANLFRRLRT